MRCKRGNQRRAKMIYVVTFKHRTGWIGFMGGRHTTKYEAEKTLANCTTGESGDHWRKSGRSEFTLRQFKNMTEAAAWRDANTNTGPIKTAVVARILTAHKINFFTQSEGDEFMDGEIQVTENITIQVGYFEDVSAVSIYDAEKQMFTHGPERKMRTQAGIDGLIADIKKLKAA
jgi:hypothetical protein